MLLDYIVSTSVIDWFLLSVQDFGLIDNEDGIDRPPWSPDRFREWIVYG